MLSNTIIAQSRHWKNPKQNEIMIESTKTFFLSTLCNALNLVSVSAPIFVRPETGLNDNLSGNELPVTFDAKSIGTNNEIVHSLAKWKRMALFNLGFEPGEGLVTTMTAIRKDEDLDNTHSILVRQFDWEKVITRDQRKLSYFQETVEKIYRALVETEIFAECENNTNSLILPDKIHFITTQELENTYPTLSPDDREHAICKQLGAVCVMKVGHALESGKPHGARSPDYDCWNLNGDIIVWYPLLNKSIELSSMGIRVDATDLTQQLEITGAADRRELPYHSMILTDKLPLTIGGGIGMDRVVMFMMRKVHIGEVQVSLWDEDTIRICKDNYINLL